MQSKRKLAMYIRLSMEDADIKTSDSKTESNSVVNQRKLLMEYYRGNPKLQEYDIVEFCDDGYSGTNFNRPRFMDMMALVRQREIHCIMVKDYCEIMGLNQKDLENKAFWLSPFFF